MRQSVRTFWTMTIKITEGARRLRAHLLRIDQTVPDFCAQHGISRRVVQNALSGQQASFTIDFAEAVAAATDGAVPASSWRQDTMREAAPDELGRLFPRHRPHPGPAVVREGYDQRTGTEG